VSNDSTCFILTNTVTFVRRQLKSCITTAAVRISTDTALLAAAIVQVTAGASYMQCTVTNSVIQVMQDSFNFVG